MNEKEKIGVTVITGFLGAGKTTLINRLLFQHPDMQFALVENEFGDVAIDTRLVKGIEASRMFELKNGCICCTISGEYELVLKELAEKFPKVNHLLIETTGIADPVPVIGPFFGDDDLQKLYYFNGTVCVVDALHFKLPESIAITGRQIAVADNILISKTEKFNQPEKEEISSRIRRFNPFAPIFFSDHGNAPGLNLMEESDPKRIFIPIQPDDHPVFTARSVNFNQPVDKLRFVEWLSYIINIHRNTILRIKGILVFQNEPYLYILQGVGGSFELTEGEQLALSKESTLVFIMSDKDLDLHMDYLQKM